MKHKFSVLVIAHNNLQGEVYEFENFKEAQAYAKARNELINMLYPKGTLQSLFRPRVVISSLQTLNRSSSVDKPDPAKRANRNKKLWQRCNELNEGMTQDIRKKIETKYLPKIRQKMSKRDLEIIECYEKAGLAQRLYGALNKEDEEHFRESIQILADSILNEEVMPTLCDIGYVF